MSYRSLNKANVRYQLTVLFLLIGAFLLAMVLINIHPTAAIIVFWLGMLLLGVAALGEWLIRKAERAAARIDLKSQHCPRCGNQVHRDAEDAHQWHCDECGATFLESGIEQT
jgi:ribosomal protein S27AE